MKHNLPILLAATAAAVALAFATGCPAKPATPAPAGPQQPASPAPAASDDSANEQIALVLRGKTEYRNCGMCHCETDPKISWDEDWVNLNHETTCIGGGSPSPEVRDSIIAYLRHPDTLRPVLVDQDFKAPQGMKTGKISVPANAGSAFLKASRDSIKEGTPAMVRLFWEDTKEEKLMTAPAGDFTVINYWLYRHGGKDGADRWSVSVTNVDGCAQLVIAEGADCWFTADPLLRVIFAAEKGESSVGLKFELYDMAGNRASLTCNGKMVFPKYEIIDAADKVMAGAQFGVT